MRKRKKVRAEVVLRTLNGLYKLSRAIAAAVSSGRKDIRGSVIYNGSVLDPIKADRQIRAYKHVQTVW